MKNKKLIDLLREVFGYPPKNDPTIKKRVEVSIPYSSPSTASKNISVSQPEPRSNPNSAQSQPSPRVEWNSAPPIARPPVVADQMIAMRGSDIARIEWGDGNTTGVSVAQTILGIEDAFDHTLLQPGERVAFCTRDKVYYHLSTWDFLKSQNQGKCCICGLSNVIEIKLLPGTPAATPPIQPAVETRVPVHPGEQVILLKEVVNYIGRAVIVQDYVHEVYSTKSTGTIFVRFEPREWGAPPFEGFKLVIFPDYQPAWTERGMSPRTYQNHYIRVRGVVQHHAKWGIEILVNSPQVIEIVDGPKN